VHQLRERRQARGRGASGVGMRSRSRRGLAELGGYTGKSSGGPPGTITISRGLAKVRAAADAIAALLAEDDDENG